MGPHTGAFLPTRSLLAPNSLMSEQPLRVAYVTAGAAGMWYYDGNNVQPDPINQKLPHKTVMTIESCGKNKILIYLSNGMLMLYNTQKKTLTKISSVKYDILDMKKIPGSNNVLLQGLGGILVYSHKDGLKEFELPDELKFDLDEILSQGRIPGAETIPVAPDNISPEGGVVEIEPEDENGVQPEEEEPATTNGTNGQPGLQPIPL